jgi:hypothetical protein
VPVVAIKGGHTGPPLRFQRGEGGAADPSLVRGFTGWKAGALIRQGGGRYKERWWLADSHHFF